MPATALQRATSVATTPAVAVGAVPFKAQLRALLSGSHWNLEWEATAKAAIERLKSDPFPVLICDAGAWEEVVHASRNLPRPPTVFVFTAAPDDGEWLKALAAGACYVDARRLDARHLFSLLNHAWRVWNKE
jgi:CheY-like chemotaxis protein